MGVWGLQEGFAGMVAWLGLVALVLPRVWWSGLQRWGRGLVWLNRPAHPRP
jgi:hypothetical protein